MSQKLSEMKFPDEYIPVALQLANNDLSMVLPSLSLPLSVPLALT
jgi:hypothetical protein